MKTETIENNLIVRLIFNFPLAIIRYCELLEEKKKFVLANQLLKSRTSIGVNIWEAQNAESKADFIHKFKVSAKEMDETNYWLLLCKRSVKLPYDGTLLEKLETISKIVNNIIKKTSANRLINQSPN